MDQLRPAIIFFRGQCHFLSACCISIIVTILCYRGGGVVVAAAASCCFYLFALLLLLLLPLLLPIVGAIDPNAFRSRHCDSSVLDVLGDNLDDTALTMLLFLAVVVVVLLP
jgi:hypothetical protein